MSPGCRHEAESLPDQVRGKNQKPGYTIAIANLLTDRAEKMPVAASGVGSEQALTNKEDCNRHQHKTEEEQADKKAYFLAD